MNQSQFVMELAKLRRSATFLVINGYQNTFGEVANYNIVFHISYQNALHRSVRALEMIVPENDLQVQAKNELLTSFNSSLARLNKTGGNEVDKAYLWFSDSNGRRINGVKLHVDSNTLHLYGLVVHKKVLMPGTKSIRKSRELTLIKNEFRKVCPVNSFRQFKITSNQVDSISVENLSLLPPSESITTSTRLSFSCDKIRK